MNELYDFGGSVRHILRWRDERWIGNGWSSGALLGNSDLEQYAILLVRVSLGLFFAISGANKLFVADGTKPVYETLVQAKVPFPHQMAYFVSGVEFVCGSLVTVGFLSSAACVALLIDMVVAAMTNSLSTIPKGLSPLNWFDDFLYLPEVLYVLFFVWLICSGPGKFSVVSVSRRQVTELIDRRSSSLLNESLMVITRMFRRGTGD